MADIKHPCRVLIVGRARSGKTTMGVKVIQQLLPQVDEFMIVSPTYRLQKTWDPIRGSVELAHDSVVTMIELLSKMVLNENGDDHTEGERIPTRRLIVLDDVSYDRSLNEGNKGTLNKLCYNAAHMNLSIVVICHKTSNIGAGMKENLEWLILFNTINGNELDNLYENFSITKKKREFHELFTREIWNRIQDESEAHPFLAVDFTKGGLVYYMLRERINLMS